MSVEHFSNEYVWDFFKCICETAFAKKNAGYSKNRPSVNNFIGPMQNVAKLRNFPRFSGTESYLICEFRIKVGLMAPLEAPSPNKMGGFKIYPRRCRKLTIK